MDIILDTSFFTNPDAYKYWGQGVSEAILAFVDKANQQSKDNFFMPVSAFDELKSFFDNQPHQVLSSLESTIKIQSPYIDKINVPASRFYELVLEIRQRSFKGLRLAERVLESGIKEERSETKTADLIRKLRKEYRQALRAGFLDSQADLDLLFLAYQLQGSLVTADQGLNIWASKFGIALLTSEGLKKRLAK